jgi:hypothetical protein
MNDDRDPLRESRNTCGGQPQVRHALEINKEKRNEYSER